MQVETCQVGHTRRFGDNARIVAHRRESGGRVCVDVTAPAGTGLVPGGAPVHPISGKILVWAYSFSPSAPRRFRFDPFEVSIWLPGELAAHAADCDGWLHIGVTPARNAPLAPRSAHVTPAVPLLQAGDDAGRLFFARVP